MGTSEEWTEPRLSGVQGPLDAQVAMIRDVFDPTAIWGESLLCHHVLKFIRVDFGKSALLRDVDLLAARELELGPAEGFNHMFLSAAWCGWTLRPGQGGPWPLCPGAFQRHRAYLSGVYQLQRKTTPC